MNIIQNLYQSNCCLINAIRYEITQLIDLLNLLIVKSTFQNQIV